LRDALVPEAFVRDPRRSDFERFAKASFCRPPEAIFVVLLAEIRAWENAQNLVPCFVLSDPNAGDYLANEGLAGARRQIDFDVFALL